MKKIVLVFITVVLTVSGFAQKTADIGIWGGSSAYWGDVKGVPPLQTFNPNFGGYFRYNFNKRVALRLMFLAGNISADGTVENIPWNFSKLATDISVMVEINYLEYLLGEKKTPFTPYILGGIGTMYFPYEVTNANLTQLLLVNNNNPLVQNGVVIDEPVVTPAIPFGFGIKFNLGERFGIGAEYIMRKLLSDKLDNLDDPLAIDATAPGGPGQDINYTDFLHNNDWPGYLGIHITYKIYLSKKACPAYDRKYW